MSLYAQHRPAPAPSLTKLSPPAVAAGKENLRLENAAWLSYENMNASSGKVVFGPLNTEYPGKQDFLQFRGIGRAPRHLQAA
jgi:hypothetical protein